MFKREVQIEQLQFTKNWDAIIIGGGATGLGVALDCASRGYKTLLLEQIDFAKGTSSRSTKLVHGGVRYLEQGNVDLVREALRERGLLMKNAPHLVRNQTFIIPNYSWFDSVLYTVGLKVYDFLSGKLSFGDSVRIGKKETSTRLTTLNKKHLKGGTVYHDGQFDDARLAVNIAQTCIENGATVLNYFKVKSILKNEKEIINGVVAKDVETGIEYKLNSKVVINATGVFSDEILKMDNSLAKKSIIPSQGIHLVFDKSFLPGEEAIMIPKTDDGRVLFLVPWHGKVLVGTTDSPIEKPSLEPKPLEKEVDFIIQNINRYLNKNVSRADVLSVFSGLRPLAAPKDDSAKTKEISRSHKILVSKSDLITITGGKWTTYRKMAEDTVDKAIQLNKLPKSICKTADLLIHGAHGASDFDNKTDYLSVYGTDKEEIEKLIQSEPKLRELIHPSFPYTQAEIVFSIRNEMARTIEDILARRVRILFLDAKVAIELTPLVGEILQKELGETNAWKENQIADFLKTAKRYQLK